MQYASLSYSALICCRKHAEKTKRTIPSTDIKIKFEWVPCDVLLGASITEFERIIWSSQSIRCSHWRAHVDWQNYLRFDYMFVTVLITRPIYPPHHCQTLIVIRRRTNRVRRIQLLADLKNIELINIWHFYSFIWKLSHTIAINSIVWG